MLIAVNKHFGAKM